MEIIEQIGAYAGLAAVLGLAVLSALYFSQARDVKRLREWAGRAPERVAEGATADQLARGVVAQPQPKVVQDAQGGTPPVPGAKPATPAAKPVPAAAAAAGATPATAAQKPGAPKPATPAATPAAAQAATDGGTEDADKVPEKVAATAATPAGAAAAAGAAGAAAPTGQAATAAPAKPGAGGPSAPAQPGAAPAQPGKAPVPGGQPSPAGPGAPGRPGAAPARPGGPPRPTVPLPSQRGAPSPSQTAILPPSQAETPWHQRLLASPRYLVLVIAGVLIVGGGLAFGVVQLTSDDDGGATAGQAPAGGEISGDDGGDRPRPAPVNAADVTVAVLNGTTIPGLAASIADRVEANGFVAGNIDNSADQGARNESVVLFTEGAEREAIAVGRKLGISQREPIDPESQAIAGDASVVVITGTDLTQ